VAGAHRTGRFLAAQHDPAAQPDAVAVAKGLGAGYAPLGAFLAPASLVDALAASTGFVISHSYDANPLACAAGSAVLDEVVERDLIANAERMGLRLRAGLEAIARRCRLVGEVRGRGLLLAIELVADPETLARFPADRDPGAIVRRHGLDHGLLLYSRRQNAGRFGDWLLIAPPLVTDEAGCDELLAGLSATLDEAAPELDRGRGSGHHSAATR
jgi:adenosylmethionine-8-amino-7-oxononanoate aminotransferase